MTSKRKRQQEVESEEEEVPETQPEDSEEEEVPKTQKGTKKRKEKNNEEAEDGKNLEAGIIEEIKLKNFMCHPNFRVEFHDRTTIIHGENGSGKSAVLTAIQVGLGSKARTTNRGNSIKDLVLTGKEHAEVMIRLRNQGRDAYKKELYGKSIIIVKGISKTGATTLKIQSSQGKTISKSNKDLAIILHSFNIQIENPTTCMTQDISREFLAGSSEAKKFQFFLSATQLKNMNDNIDKANKNTKIMGDMYADKCAAFEESTEELKRREELFKDTERVDILRTELSELQAERLWATYNAKVAQMEQFVKYRADLQTVLDQLIEKRNSSTGLKLAELQKRKAEIDVEIDGIANKLYLLNQEANTIVNKKKDIDTRTRSTQQTRQKINKEIHTLEQEIQLFQRNKNETLSKNKTDKDSAIQGKQDEINKVQDDIERFDQNKKQAEEESVSLKSNKDQLSKEMYQIKTERGGVDEEIRRLSDEESKLRQSRNDKLAFFGGQSMRKFLTELSNSKNFSKPPIGPIGLLLSVKEEHLDWAAAIEQSLSKNLSTFIVDNFKDGEELSRLKKKYNIRSTHIIQQYTNKAYDLSAVLPRDHITMYHALDVDLNSLKVTPLKYDDTDVLKTTLINMLINQSRVEKNVLIKDFKEAQSFVDKYPSYEAVTITGTRIFRKSGSSVTDVYNAPRSKLWTKSVEEEIIARQRSIEELRRKIKEIEVNERKVQSELDIIHQSLTKKNEIVKTMSRKIDSLKQFIEKKKKEINEIAGEEDNDQQFIEELEGKIRTCEEKVAIHREKLKDEEKKMDDLKVEVNECSAQIVEAKAKVVEAQKEKESRDREAFNIMQEIDNENRICRTIDNEILQYQSKVQQQNTVVEEVTALVDQARLTAEGSGFPHRQTNSNPEVLKMRTATLKETINREEKRLGELNPSEIKKDYLDYKRTYDEKKSHLEICAQALEKTKEGVLARTRTMEKIKNVCISTVSQFFGRYMSQKGHSGQIVVDDGELKFDIHMATHGAKVNVKDAKSLSGGEKSFTTVSFLLSIWELVETPFRAVDEFDVFMDNMYRKTAMDLILKTAKTKHPTRQLIIITPQDVSIVDKDPDYLKIIKLKPPQRDENQRTMEEFVHNHQM